MRGQVFSVTGGVPQQVDAASEGLFGDRQRVWERDISKEFRRYVKEMLTGPVYVYFSIDREAPGRDAALMDSKWLARETMVRRRRRGYEQFVSRRAPEGSPSFRAADEPREYYFEFHDDEVLCLHWPLGEGFGSKTPATRARAKAAGIDRLHHQHLLTLRAAADPRATTWVSARGRLASFDDVLQRQKDLEATLADILYVPPPGELTEYFRVDRIIRSRTAAIAVRDYIIDRFNAKVLKRWCAINNWQAIQLVFTPTVWSREEWVDLGHAYREGEASFDDVVAATEAERA